jgi:hypothetical protein
MSSFFTQLSTDQAGELLPKVQVAAALYRKHNALLAKTSIREQIAGVDSDVGALLSMIYDKKLISWQELTRRMRRQEQNQERVAVHITSPDRFEKQSLAKEATISGREDVWLFATGKWKIYKRSLTHDIDTLLD